MSSVVSPEPIAANPAPAERIKVSFTSYIPTLDGWRAIAILMVIMEHISSSLVEFFGDSLSPYLYYFTFNGKTGVRIFFGISGFLITSRLLAEMSAGKPRILKQFYIRRAFRILPPALTFLAVIAVLMWTGMIPTHWPNWLSAMFFYANYQSQGWYVGHFWSLSIEEQFYLFWPGLLILLGLRRGTWFAVGGVLALWLYKACCYRFQFHIQAEYASYTEFHVDAILWGAAIACLCTSQQFCNRVKSALSGNRVLVLMALFFLSFALAFPGWKTYLVVYAAQIFIIPFMLLATAMHPASILSKILEWPFITWIGRISYSIYIWQQIFLAPPRFRSPNLSFIQSFPQNLILALGCAVASYYLLERPMISLGRKLAGRTPKQSPANKQPVLVT